MRSASRGSPSGSRRLAIDIDRQPDEKAPAGSVTIWNLAVEREAQIVDRGERLTVIAGYAEAADRTAIVFQGAAERITRERRALERLTRIEVGSVAEAMTRSGVISVRTYAGKVSARQIVSDLVGDLGLFVGPLDPIPAALMATDWTWASRTDAGCPRSAASWGDMV